jgi:hypothetical protein
MSKLFRKCVHCKRSLEVNKDIEWMSCPYESDIANDHSKMWHCYDCASQCHDDI